MASKQAGASATATSSQIAISKKAGLSSWPSKEQDHEKKKQNMHQRGERNSSRRRKVKQEEKLKKPVILTEEQKSKVQKVFNFLDINRDGLIDKGDLRHASSLIGEKLWDSEIEFMLAECGCGPLTLDSFVDSVGAKAEQIDSYDTLLNAFMPSMETAQYDNLTVAQAKSLLCGGREDCRLTEQEWSQLLKAIPGCISSTGNFDHTVLLKTISCKR
ncbi:myosin regulatory light chain 2A, cardiac muscle isoform-like [Convolutriloba macropyga]|uniref:myosin regulatory light chain 2A, cardiac muscle isoform-like n=1 Tax=Convolutriloba macropyga TaxID=536237 RepID=UPI003F52705A